MIDLFSNLTFFQIIFISTVRCVPSNECPSVQCSKVEEEEAEEEIVPQNSDVKKSGIRSGK